MCNSHDHGSLGISRRGLGLAALAGATAMAFAPGAFAASEIDAFSVMCIDYRLVTRGVEFFDSHQGPGPGNYDLVALAGASLSAASETMFLPTVPGFWQQLGAAYKLHKIKKVVVLDHMGCGAFAEAFNGGNPLPPDREHALHVAMMTHLKQLMPERAPGVGAPVLPLEFWLFPDPNSKALLPPERINIP
jgi:hypothetical protein